MADFLRAWENYRVAAEEYRELDQERVLVLHHFAGRGKTSGADLRQMRAEGASLFLVRTGKVVRLVNYIDRDRPARRAAHRRRGIASRIAAGLARTRGLLSGVLRTQRDPLLAFLPLVSIVLNDRGRDRAGSCDSKQRE
jgi:hypothetical protein